MLDQIDQISVSPSKIGRQNKKACCRFLPLHKGEVVEGRIIKAIHPRHAIIMIKGKELVARSRVPLQPGELAVFKVEEPPPQCILKLLKVSPRQENDVGLLLRNRGFRVSPYELLIDILNPSKSTVEKLPPQKVRDTLRRMQALLNRISLMSHEISGDGKLFFPISMQINNRFFPGELLIHLPEKGKEKSADNDKAFRLSFLLEMSHLGPVRGDVSIFQKAVSVGFWVSDERVQSLFNESAVSLKRRLERHGFRLQELACRIEEAGSVHQSSLAEEFAGSKEYLVNLIV